MKKYMVCLLCFTSSLFSCKKEAANGLQNELNGEWELRITDYTSAQKEHPAGNGNVFMFYAGNRYTRTDIIDSDTTNTTGTYSITKGATCNSGEVTFVRFGNETGNSILLLSGDTLHLNVNSCTMADGANLIYKKIK